MDIKHKILSLAKEYFSEIVEYRRHIHKYPELSFKEYDTSIINLAPPGATSSPG